MKNNHEICQEVIKTVKQSQGNREWWTSCRALYCFLSIAQEGITLRWHLSREWMMWRSSCRNLRKRILGRCNSRFKGLETEVCLAYSRNRKKDSAAGLVWAEGGWPKRDEAKEVEYDIEGLLDRLCNGAKRILVEGALLLEAYVRGRECMLSETETSGSWVSLWGSCPL